ncbi:MAG: alpha,4-glucan--maltose-phosphate maltosyltransferase [Verrucomicrobiaceae bacterium]|nr:alpha,4-glucan--maltose-phosphate maltosyltransferase [Verrucomicrobiaceae bacterium]
MTSVNPQNFTNDQVPAAVLAALTEARIAIEHISPSVDGGRFPAKGIVDQHIPVEATIFMDGHDHLAAQIVWRAVDVEQWNTTPLRAMGNDRWVAGFIPEQSGMHEFAIEAWSDRWGTYRDELEKKERAGVATALEIQEGRILVRAIADQNVSAKSSNARQVYQLARQLASANDERTKMLLLTDGVHELMSALDERRFLQRTELLRVDVERTAAGFSSWYELFPRSQTRADGTHGTFDDVIARLPAIHAMGFDVLYFPPIHPIGRTHRKGRDNQLTAAPDDPGSPYAIGSEEGGHDAVHPDLGGIDAFRRLRAAASDYDIEIALDFAVQCSPDHPWLQQHPEWFSWRPDGSIRYAENPPKKYEDIVNVDFYAEGAQPSLWVALRDVVQSWVDEGVKIFRVDNPHTKPLPFWQWLIADIRSRHPDAIFLAEAFTRPAMMYELAKIGFTQSYTYFTWRKTKEELTDYLIELSSGEPRDFFRPHFFVNTPDINPYFLQTSGRGGFQIRAALAATLSGLWGVYSGFELCEGEPVPGKEEYLHSEKYEIKPRDWNAPGNIIGLISSLNRIRKENAALQTHLGLKFLGSGNDQVLYFSKATADRSNVLLIAISLDPKQSQEAYLEVPLQLLADDLPARDIKEDLHGAAIDTAAAEKPAIQELHVEELLRGQTMIWSGAYQHWYFDPNELPLAIWRVALPQKNSAASHQEPHHEQQSDREEPLAKQLAPQEKISASETNSTLPRGEKI